MNQRSNIQAKMLNAMLTGKNFVNRDTEEYIYASLTQPPIKIIDKCGSDDEMEYILQYNIHKILKIHFSLILIHNLILYIFLDRSYDLL